MDVDRILSTFNAHRVDYILIGGMNFFLNHAPVATFDVDLWIDDGPDNRTGCHEALAALEAEVCLEPKGVIWQKVADLDGPRWLEQQAVHYLFSPAGPIDVFRFVPGLEAGFRALKGSCPERATPAGVPYRSLNDALMIQCQLALDKPVRKLDRLRALGYRDEEGS